MARLEEAIATRLGKERAIFMPTGTLANHLALRRHCGTGGRAAVQEQSHLFNDTGDSVQRLSGINLVPLSPGRTGFTASELDEAFRTSVTGRVLNPISAVMVETRSAVGRERWSHGTIWSRSRTFAAPSAYPATSTGRAFS